MEDTDIVLMLLSALVGLLSVLIGVLLSVDW